MQCYKEKKKKKKNLYCVGSNLGQNILTLITLDSSLNSGFHVICTHTSPPACTYACIITRSWPSAQFPVRLSLLGGLLGLLLPSPLLYTLELC